ncbi:hypothetical protein BGZ83_000963 [Gryganskiella cystojenkinii]|nr:hypothetical protein BGZ83_000963 [Gryganskiella cystojenkinii]
MSSRAGDQDTTVYAQDKSYRINITLDDDSTGITACVTIIIIKADPAPISHVQDAIQFLIAGLEKENHENSSSPKVALLSTLALGRLKACCQSFLSASYHCLYAAGMTSIMSEESSWIGSSAHPQISANGGKAFSASTRNAFVERDRANGRLYYEALYVLKVGLEDLIKFIKTEPSAAKLYASLDQPFKEFKHETDPYLK